MSVPVAPSGAYLRAPAVAGTFYPRDAGRLRELVDALLETVGRPAGRARGAVPGALPGGAIGSRRRLRRLPTGILVPHAGLAYSGLVAAAGWACLRPNAGTQPERRLGADTGERPGPANAAGSTQTVVILGTNHTAAWLDGVGVWPAGAWDAPFGAIEVDGRLAHAVAALGPPFSAAAEAHLGEHSIEVQLPLLAAVAPGARIVPLAVACGTGERAVAAGERLGRLLASRRAAGSDIVLAISSDMAHYPTAREATTVTEHLLPALETVDAVALAGLEASLRSARIPGLSCGMCGIEPAVMGLAALRSMGARQGIAVASATSADAGGPAGHAVGYLSVRFDA